ncbi:ACT domain-containing protein [Paraferrimonas sedimenticola]|uniref:Amino acid-binding protein n=1 Tax=Paraferrimonas sedimenticola TaxID=375674 RepID=A0AA37RNL0_9GAMM|nr:ACT domain-containing protein [Paraferrimonas sedimenticola]GLP94748.1 amino acid-binding protein [Paraferrimonas sedimenticola]
MANLTLAVLDGEYSIHSLPPNADIPTEVMAQPLYFIGKTQDEVSILVPSSLPLVSDEVESGWKCLEVLGPLGFSMVGIMARVSTTLANANISILAVSTFDTDYVFVKSQRLEEAAKALRSNSYQVLYPDK